MQRLLLRILGVLVYLNAFSQGNLNWPESVVATNSTAAIALQAVNFPFFNVLLPGEITPQPIPLGSVIGVFFDSDGNPNTIDWICGGFEEWTDESIAIVTYGDDPLTSVLDGFISGQPY